MGSAVTAPVNEATNLLYRTSPAKLSRLRAAFPEISDDLQPGMMAGEDEPSKDQQGKMLLAKGRVMIAALAEARSLCDTALPEAASRMKKGGNVRLGSQIVTTVATSGVLGALGATKPVLAAISGFFALVASIAALCADYMERVVDPKQGNLSAIYVQLVDARYKAGALHDTIAIQMEYGGNTSEIEKSIADGNALCEEINRSFYQVIQKLSKAGSSTSMEEESA